RESPRSSRECLQDPKGLGAAAQGHEHGGARSHLASKIQVKAGVDFTIVATEYAGATQALSQKLGFADQAKVALDRHRPGGGATDDLLTFHQRNNDAVSVGDRVQPVADELQYFVEDESFGLKQIWV